LDVKNSCDMSEFVSVEITKSLIKSTSHKNLSFLIVYGKHHFV